MEWKDILLSAGGGGGEQQTVGGNSRKMRRAKQRGRMVKMKKMIKHENERNQRSGNGSSHTRGPRKTSAAAQSCRSVPKRPRTGMMPQRAAPKPGLRVTVKERD